MFYKINKEIKKTDKEFLRGRPKIEQFPPKNNPVQNQPQQQSNNNNNTANKNIPIPNKALGKIGSVPETRSSTRQREQQPQPQTKQPMHTSNSTQPLKRKREEPPVVKDELPTTSYNNTITNPSSKPTPNTTVSKSNDKSKSNDDMFMTSANNDFQNEI